MSTSGRSPVDGNGAARSLRISDPDALARQVADELGARPDRGERGGLDREVERRRQPDRPDHPQRVLAEPRRGVADRPERARREVGPAVVRVDEPRLAAGFGTPRHRIDREVATRQVHLDRVAELDSMRPPVVGVVVVGSEGRDLDVADRSVTAPDRDGPELVLVDGPREQARRRSRAAPRWSGPSPSPGAPASRSRRDPPTTYAAWPSDHSVPRRSWTAAGIAEGGSTGARPASSVSSAPGRGMTAMRRCARPRGTA